MTQKVACHISREGKFWVYLYVCQDVARAEGKCVGHPCAQPREDCDASLVGNCC